MKIINSISTKNIQDLYNIKSISENGQINTAEKFIFIYKIDPANIIACDEETKHRIYQAYITCIRGLPDNFQIIISRERADFNKQIQLYRKRIKEIQNEKLRSALQKYIEYLDEISNVNKLYKNCHYLVVENMKTDEANEIINIFSNLEEFGIRINLIKSKEQIKSILKKYIVKE